jgi:drug/metabolite transporter (DMT)-like permease
VLALSAFVGLVIGDGALFYAFVKIGPRLAMLIMTLVPVMSAFFAWVCFDEIILPIEYLGIGITVCAIGWVVTERKTNRKPEKDKFRPAKIDPTSREFIVGVTMAFVGALGQTGNLIITKYALVDDYSELSATELRIFVSLMFLVVWTVLSGRLGSTFRKLRNKKALTQTAVGALVGPFLGIWFSYIAIEYGRIGIASTIISTSPLLLIPLSAVFLHERSSFRSLIGTAVALSGVAILCFASSLGQSGAPREEEKKEAESAWTVTEQFGSMRTTYFREWDSSPLVNDICRHPKEQV